MNVMSCVLSLYPAAAIACPSTKSEGLVGNVIIPPGAVRHCFVIGTEKLQEPPKNMARRRSSRFLTFQWENVRLKRAIRSKPGGSSGGHATLPSGQGQRVSATVPHPIITRAAVKQ